MKEPKVYCSHTGMLETNSLRPNPKNPNKHPKEQIELLAALICWHGWRVPITVSKRSGLIVTGEARWSAAKLLELKSVPVDLQSYETEGLELADLIADNKIAELSILNLTTVKELLKRMPEGMRLHSGMRAPEIETLLTSREAKTGDDTIDPQVVFKTTQEQSLTINRAIKEAANGAVPPGAALHLICAKYLG